MWKWEVGGLAFATALSAWVQAIWLFYLLRKRIGPFGGREILRSFLYGCVAGLCMGTLSGLVAFWLLAHAPLIIRVGASISVGVLFYFYASKVLKIKEFDFFVDLV